MPTHYLYLPKSHFPVGVAATVHRVFADEDNTFSATCLDAGGTKTYLTFSAGYNGNGGGTFTVSVQEGSTWRSATYSTSNIWEWVAPVLPSAEDPACPGCRKPQRPPCHRTDWPAAPTLTFCNQQSSAAERAIPLRCNTETLGTTPTYAAEGSCPDWHAGNCYSTCPTGSAHDLTTDASGYAIGSTIIVLGSGIGTLYPGDTLRFDGDDTLYTIASTALPSPLLPTSDLTGYNITLQAPGLLLAIAAVATPFTVIPRGTLDFSLCDHTGWKAVRASTYWHGRRGFESGCDACATETTHYLTVARNVTHAHLETGPGDYTVTAARTLAVSATTGIVSETACSLVDPGSHGLDTKAEILLLGDWCNGPSFTTLHPSDPGGTFGALMNTMFTNALAGSGTDHYEDSSGGITTYYDVTLTTHTDTQIAGTLVITNSSDPGYSDTLTFSWLLSVPYLLSEAITNAFALADLFPLDDDVSYPWRTEAYGPNNVAGTDYHLPIPLVTRRESGTYSLDYAIGATCGTLPDCNGSTPCPYDGQTVGAPLPHGYGPHYHFGDAGLGVLTDLGWNPGYQLPETATQWTAYPDTGSVYADFPPGGWVQLNGNLVTVQKWAQTRTPTASANFFRPCGADSRSDPNYRAICGRCAVASVSESAGTVTLTLTDAAPYLIAGDSLTLLTYATDFTEQPLATLILTTITSDTVVAGTWDYSPDAPLPVTGLYAKATAAPHYSWDDAATKGDALFCVATTDLCTSAVTRDCVPACTRFNPCEPEVLTILGPASPENFQAAAEYRFESTGWTQNAGIRVIVSPRSEESDPLWTGDPAEAPQIESRCSPPDGAPDGTTYTGCASALARAARLAAPAEALTATTSTTTLTPDTHAKRLKYCTACEWNHSWTCQHIACKICPGRARKLGTQPLLKLLTKPHFHCPARHW